MTEKRFIYDGLHVRDNLDKIPLILTHNEEQRKQFLDGLNELNDEREILFDTVKKADDLINRFGGDELKHKWEKEVIIKYR